MRFSTPFKRLTFLRFPFRSGVRVLIRKSSARTFEILLCDMHGRRHLDNTQSTELLPYLGCISVSDLTAPSPLSFSPPLQNHELSAYGVLWICTTYMLYICVCIQ